MDRARIDRRHPCPFRLDEYLLALVQAASPFGIGTFEFLRPSGHVAIHEFRYAPSRHSIHRELAHTFVNPCLPFPADVKNGSIFYLHLYAPGAVGYQTSSS